MEAVVLAGGLGTRLRTLVSDMPKPMAPVAGRPFLSYLLDYLVRQNIRKIILATGYKREKIYEYYGDSFKEAELIYSEEQEPLGTGGALKQALHYVTSADVFVLNGDTFFNVDLQELMGFHLENQAHVTLSLKEMNNFDRYGTVEVVNHRVVKFNEKKYTANGKINGGVYVVNAHCFDLVDLPSKFSFEVDFMQAYTDKLKIFAFESKGYFIDIGVPEDYLKAQSELIKFAL